MEQRLNTLAALLPDEADAALIISGENRRYFTDFISSLGYLLVSRQQSWLFVDSRYEEAARAQAKKLYGGAVQKTEGQSWRLPENKRP